MRAIALTVMATAGLLLAATTTLAQPGKGGNGYRVCEFIDENGDGFNDLAPDADGDGIPNGLDSDYVRPKDGTGAKFGPGGAAAGPGGQGAWGMHWFRYLWRNHPAWGPGNADPGRGFAWGPGDGTGSGAGPGDGTGYGPGSGTGGGECDGTGPNGPQGPGGPRGNGGRN
jgi:hypothetical protein